MCARQNAALQEEDHAISWILSVPGVAGVGGGAGFAAAQLSGQPSGSASGATASTTSGQDGVQTTVVQGDPTNPDWATVAAAASRAFRSCALFANSTG